MTGIFLSYESRDSDMAKMLAVEFEAAGFPTWFYERDGLPVESHLIQTSDAIDNCQAFLVIISENSIDSHEVDSEIQYAHSRGKCFVPVLHGISHRELGERKRIWHRIIATGVSIEIPSGDISAVVRPIVDGLKLRGIEPGTPSGPCRPTETSRRPASSVEMQGLDALDSNIAVEDGRKYTAGSKPDTEGLYGRQSVANEYSKRIVSGEIRFLSLYGTAGIGKSSIASMVAASLADIPDGFKKAIWYDLKNEPAPGTVLLHLATIANNERLPFTENDRLKSDALLDLLRAKMRGCPAVVVFDNIDSAFDPNAEAGTFADEIWPRMFRVLLEAGSVVITTSRQVPGFIDAHAAQVEVGGIDKDEALRLMKDAGLQDDDRTLAEAVELLQGHPMALTALAAEVLRKPRYKRLLKRAGDIIDAIKRSPDRTKNPIVFFQQMISPERLPPGEFKLITAMSVLSRAETADVIAKLRPDLGIELVEKGLDELFLRSLVRADRDADPPVYSLHALIKEVAGTHVDDHSAITRRAFEHYVSIPWNRGTKKPGDVEHLRLAVQYALSMKDLEKACFILYQDVNLAGMLTGWGRHDLAIPLHRKELLLARQVGDADCRKRATEALAKCMIDVGDQGEALVLAREALDIAASQGDRISEGKSKFYIGRIHYNTGDWDKSFESLEDALRITIETGNIKKEVPIRWMLGVIAYRRGNFDEALSGLGKALEMAKSICDNNCEINILASIGHIHYIQSDFEHALNAFTPALDLAVGIGDKFNESKIYMLIGQVYWSKGNYKSALEQYEAALGIASEIGNRRQEGVLQTSIGKIFYNRGDYERALPFFENSLTLAVELKSKAAEAFYRGCIGETCLMMGDYEKASEYLNSALDFAISIGNRTNEGPWRGRIGELHLKRGEYDKALESLGMALDIANSIADKENQAEWGGSIGRVYIEMKDYPKAKAHLEKALELAIEIEDPVVTRIQHVGLGRLYLALGEPCEAVPHFESALEIARSLDMVESTLHEMGNLLNTARGECKKST